VLFIIIFGTLSFAVVVVGPPEQWMELSLSANRSTEAGVVAIKATDLHT